MLLLPLMQNLRKKYGITKVACVRQDKSNGFKRFAFAHELAHYIFDYNEERELKYYNTYNKELGVWMEKRTNIFVANVFVPESQFKEKYTEYKEQTNSMPDTIKMLSKFFLVSTSCIETRVSELFGKLKESPKRGWCTKESERNCR